MPGDSGLGDVVARDEAFYTGSAFSWDHRLGKRLGRGGVRERLYPGSQGGRDHACLLAQRKMGERVGMDV
jgi:hypothetical protein